MHGVTLADETFLPGSCAVIDDDLEITTTIEAALQHMQSLMNPEATKRIVYHLGNPVATYEGYTKFLYMQPDKIDGKMDFWLTKERIYYAEENSNQSS